jgi:hypothetical protein
MWWVKFRPVPKMFWDAPDKPAVGVCLFDKRTILVDPNADEPFWTLVHEIAHACFPDVSEVPIEHFEFTMKKILTRYPKHIL